MKKVVKRRLDDGAVEGNRTSDLRVTNAMLYQLSYNGTGNILAKVRGFYSHACLALAAVCATLVSSDALPLFVVCP